MQIRSNAESLAFLGSALTEGWRADKKLDALLKVLVKKTNWQYLLDCAVSVFDYSGSIVSYLMLAIPIFAGRYDGLSSAELSGLISQVSESLTTDTLLVLCHYFVLFLYLSIV